MGGGGQNEILIPTHALDNYAAETMCDEDDRTMRSLYTYRRQWYSGDDLKPGERGRGGGVFHTPSSHPVSGLISRPAAQHDHGDVHDSAEKNYGSSRHNRKK